MRTFVSKKAVIDVRCSYNLSCIAQSLLQVKPFFSPIKRSLQEEQVSLLDYISLQDLTAFRDAVVLYCLVAVGAPTP